MAKKKAAKKKATQRKAAGPDWRETIESLWFLYWSDIDHDEGFDIIFGPFETEEAALFCAANKDPRAKPGKKYFMYNDGFFQISPPYDKPVKGTEVMNFGDLTHGGKRWKQTVGELELHLPAGFRPKDRRWNLHEIDSVPLIGIRKNRLKDVSED